MLKQGQEAMISRMQVLEQFHTVIDTDAFWRESTSDEQIWGVIKTQLMFIKDNWSLFDWLVPIEFQNQSLSTHLDMVRDMVSNQRSYEDVEGGNVLSQRQEHVYKLALNALLNNNYREFFHQLRDFIENYRHTINEPINLAEKAALATMIHYFSQAKLTNHFPEGIYIGEVRGEDAKEILDLMTKTVSCNSEL